MIICVYPCRAASVVIKNPKQAIASGHAQTGSLATKKPENQMALGARGAKPGLQRPCSLYLLSSGLYRRPRSFTGSCTCQKWRGARGLYRRSGMERLAHHVRTGHLHPAPKVIQLFAMHCLSCATSEAAETAEALFCQRSFSSCTAEDLLNISQNAIGSYDSFIITLTSSNFNPSQGRCEASAVGQVGDFPCSPINRLSSIVRHPSPRSACEPFLAARQVRNPSPRSACEPFLAAKQVRHPSFVLPNLGTSMGVLWR